jgi:hypothetical protein
VSPYRAVIAGKQDPDQDPDSELEWLLEGAVADWDQLMEAYGEVLRLVRRYGSRTLRMALVEARLAEVDEVGMTGGDAEWHAIRQAMESSPGDQG